MNNSNLLKMGMSSNKEKKKEEEIPKEDNRQNEENNKKDGKLEKMDIEEEIKDEIKDNKNEKNKENKQEDRIKEEEKQCAEKKEEKKDILKDKKEEIGKDKEIKKEQNELKTSEKDIKLENKVNNKEDSAENKAKKENEEKLEEKELKKEQTSEELEKLINYKYNDKGELRHKETGQGVGKLSQKEYELVGKYVQKYVEELLIKKFNLTTLYVPNSKSTDFTIRDESQPQCKIVTTKDFPTNPKCLMLIQGTGAVRLGQWARSVCINENIYLGSMIPYVELAIKNNFSVIIFNPNESRDFLYEEKRIKEFSTMQDHSVYVYNNIIKTNKNIKDIYIVAHSMGGACTVEILLENKEDLLSGKIKKIAFTDSVHGEEYKYLGNDGIEQFRKISRNYIGSKKPAGEFVRDYTTSYGGVDCYSSGHHKHEYTSGYAIDEIFKYFNCKN